ncbi:hypothetical protein L1049_000708 [Liquidambar formosana]|uniref:SWIM-type domain-containing protein n=1 Tax=Liquidambar formosana TaxID=63359 RepID=A0AAP0NB22_LIQFO
MSSEMEINLFEDNDEVEEIGTHQEAEIDIGSDQDNLEGNDREEINTVVHCHGEPVIGTKVHGEDEAYSLYNDYAVRVGFSVRKGSCRYDRSGALRQRTYMCSKQGFYLDANPYETKNLNKLEARTGCNASIRFTVEDGVWVVTHFNPEHNHEFAKAEERQYLRSNRRAQDVQAVRSIVNDGIRKTKLDSSLSKEGSGAGGVGFMKREYVFLHAEKLNVIEAGDGQGVINLFKHKQAEDPMFFYTVQVDQENRLANFFWRDGRSKFDYGCFGDVAVFDSTYRINKYNMVCALFLGVNHHWKNVLFGCAFLVDESTASFTWLFETFLESMGNQHPKTIFTNHCQAMANSIEKVFPDTHHRLCLWHINKDAARHLSNLYENPDFKTQFNKCLQGCHTETEFQSTWDDLIEGFNLSDNRWLKTLYDLRIKWCKVFSPDTFTGKITSSQRTESTYSVFHSMSSKRMNLTQFVCQYEEIVRQFRSDELKEDFCCNQGAPPKVVSNSGILNCAADVYTHKIYKLFESEFVASLGVKMEEVSGDGTVHSYQLSVEGHKRMHIVQYNSFDCTVMCSCKMFESMGLLCRHALRVINVNNITKIPAQFILKRWTKSAKNGLVVYDDGKPSCENEKSSVTLRLNDLMHTAYNIMTKSALSATTTKIAKEKLAEIVELIQRDITTLNVDGNLSKEDDDSIFNKPTGHANNMNCSVNEIPVLASPCVRLKEVTNARLESKLEKRKKKAFKDSTTPPQPNHIVSEKNKQPTIRGPSQISFHAPHNPTFFRPLFPPLGVPMGSNFHNQFLPTTGMPPTNVYSHFPPSIQGPSPTWTIGHPNFRFTSMLQSNDAMPHLSQDSSTSSIGNQTFGQLPH